MLGTGRAISMTDEEFRLLRALICDYCGIFFEESMKFLVERRLRPRLPLLGFTTFREYYRFLRYGGESSAEFDEIVERVTTNETYFFRELRQLEAFAIEVAPKLVENTPKERQIRIWSAGCSTGEEPYTLAMLLAKHLPKHHHRFDIFGNDISRKVLSTARRGVYLESSFRTTPEEPKKAFFQEEGKTLVLNEDIRRSVTFGHMNLVDERATALLGFFDVVFCRNVLIYFDDASRKLLLQTFRKKLYPNGYLFLGHAESLLGESASFALESLERDLVYRKPASEAEL